MKFFDRNEKVVVQLGDGAVFAKGRVLFDNGADTIVIDRHGHPAKLTRVPRGRVQKPNGQGTRSKPVPTAVSISCMATEHGWCATQVQSRKLTKAECIQGVWTVCGTWAVSSSGTRSRDPDCIGCRERLGMGVAV